MSESLRKALLILDVLRDSEAGLSARDLAARLDLPKSTAQRLLQTLEQSRMAAQDPVTRKYGLGPHTLTLGMAYRDRLDLRNVALPHMRRLRDTVEETVGLSVAVGATRMFIEEVQSQSELRARSELGQPYPLWMGAPGRVLLADLGDDELRRILDQADESSWRAVSPATREGFVDHLAVIRGRGHDRACDETIVGISAAAVPVRDATGRVCAALSVSGPTARMSPATMDSILPDVLHASAAISRALGGRVW
ncbi:MAG: IclR family transcriptional regulator [Pseudonocardia sp.]|nr:IclR family transcriptional regulator [Pseudonocardia sp.]